MSQRPTTFGAVNLQKLCVAERPEGIKAYYRLKSGRKPTRPDAYPPPIDVPV